MKCKEFLFVRKKGVLALKTLDLTIKLSYEEAALLCHLYKVGEPLKASELADYQQVIRPTMTHRLARLTDAGYIERQVGQNDQRVLYAALTSEGTAVVIDLSHALAAQIRPQETLHRCPAQRLIRYIEAAGSISCKVSDVLILTLWEAQDEMSPALLHSATGLLQPSCAMAISRLVAKGLLEQHQVKMLGTLHPKVYLTEAGKKEALRLKAEVERITVHRN